MNKFDEEIQAVLFKYMSDAAFKRGNVEIADIITSMLQCTVSTILTFAHEDPDKRQQLIKATSDEFLKLLNKGNERWNMARKHATARVNDMSVEEVQQALRDIGIKV